MHLFTSTELRSCSRRAWSSSSCRRRLPLDRERRDVPTAASEEPAVWFASWTGRWTRVSNPGRPTAERTSSPSSGRVERRRSTSPGRLRITIPVSPPPTGRYALLWDALPHAGADRSDAGPPDPRAGRLRPRDDRRDPRRGADLPRGVPRRGRRTALPPTIHARVDDTIYLHGSRGARAWKALKDGAEVCLVATIVDGLVLARSAFHHSMNYRSVVVYGTAREVTDPEDSTGRRARSPGMSHPGGRMRLGCRPTRSTGRRSCSPCRWRKRRPRSGPGLPRTEDEDLDLPIWAGVLPLVTSRGPRARATSPMGSTSLRR